MIVALLLGGTNNATVVRPCRRPRASGHLLDVTVGCGYRPWLAGPWLAGLWLLALTLLGALSFGTHTPDPVQRGDGAPFQPLVYTLDLLIPIGALGRRTSWYWTNGGLQWLAYLLIVFGWVLTTAVIAGVTRALQKTQRRQPSSAVVAHQQQGLGVPSRRSSRSRHQCTRPNSKADPSA